MQATRKLWKYLRPYWLWAVLAPLLMMLEVAMDLPAAAHGRAHHRPGHRHGRHDRRGHRTGVLMVGVAVIGVVGGMGCTVFCRAGRRASAPTCAHALFAKVQSLSFGNLDKLETGEADHPPDQRRHPGAGSGDDGAADHGARAAADGRQPDHGRPDQPAAGPDLLSC